MPSIDHEALVDLFRVRPSLVPELLRDALRVELPAFEVAVVSETSFTQVVPTEYRADLTVLLKDGAGLAVAGVVVEVQLGPDGDKRYSWPLYVAALYSRLRCPVYLLVVAPDAGVADWARRITEAPPFAPPLVLGPRQVPRITDAKEAVRATELAVLSAIAHGHEEGALEIALAAIGAVARLDEERSALYYDVVLGALNEAARNALESQMEIGSYEFKSEFVKKNIALGRDEGRVQGLSEGRVEGRVEGQVNALITVLSARGLAVSDALKERIVACRDSETLERWIARAAVATTVEDVVAG